MNVAEWLVSAEAARWRRSLDALAWVVLEAVVLAADDDAVVEVSARRLAADVGFDRDAVARALARLCTAGVLVRLSQRRDGGRFGAGRFELRLPCLSSTDTSKAGTVKAATVGTGRPRPVEPSVVVTEQGSLFDAAPAPPASIPTPRVPNSRNPRASARTDPSSSTQHLPPTPPQPAHELASAMRPGRSPRPVKGEGGPC